MADKSIWPELPAGWSYGTAEQQVGDPGPKPDKNADIGSVFRQIPGPRLPVEQPSVVNDFLLPVGKKTLSYLPHSPADIGTFAATLIFGGPEGLLAKGAMKYAPSMVDAVGSLGTTALQRILGVGAGGAAGAALGGDSPIGGAAQGITTQIGGEGISKLTRWLRMSAQARDLALEDPARLGAIVKRIIPGLGEIKSAPDFFKAFKLAGADNAVSEAYARGVSEISQATQGQLFPSPTMDTIRSKAKVVTPLTAGWGAGQQAGNVLPTAGQPGQYTFDDISETVRRLRKVGWTGDEAARGLDAIDARKASSQLADDLMAGLAPEQQDKWRQTNTSFARGTKIIEFMDDKKLFKKNDELDIPALQRKLKEEGYPVRDSYEVIADALALQEGAFRRPDGLTEDVPGQAGKLLDHFRLHFGIVPTVYPRLPVVGQYSGRAPYGLGADSGGLIAGMLKRGVSGESKPITLGKPEE